MSYDASATQPSANEDLNIGPGAPFYVEVSGRRGARHPIYHLPRVRERQGRSRSLRPPNWAVSARVKLD